MEASMQIKRFIGLCSLVALPGLALGAAHVHGVAKMDVSVDGARLAIAIEMPLDSAVGFEHVPKTDAQKTALDDAMRLLRNPAGLFVLPPEAECAVDSVEVSEPFPGGRAKAGGHADFDADYIFRCARPAALNRLETTLFNRFPALKRIDVQRVTPSGQGKALLTGDRPVLRW